MLRWPVAVPVRTSFGTMHDRPAVLVRVEDAEGAHRLGRGLVQLPVVRRRAPRAADRDRARAARSSAARSRRRRAAFDEMIAPDRRARDPVGRARAARAGDRRRRHRAARPRRAARRAAALAPAGAGARPRRPRHGDARPRRSRSTPAASTRTIPRRPWRALRAAGYTRVQAQGRLRRRRATSPTSPRCAPRSATRPALMVDANQAWDLETAHRAWPGALAPSRPGLARGAAARRPALDANGSALAQASPMPLAAGENAHRRRGVRRR